MTKRIQTTGADSLKPLRRELNLSPEDAEIAASFSQPLPPFSEIAAARIRRRLEHERAQAGSRHRLPMWLTVTVGIAASLFLLETAAAAAISAWPALHDRFWATVGAHLPKSGPQRVLAEVAAQAPPTPQPLVAESTASAAGDQTPAPIPFVARDVDPPAATPPARRVALLRPPREPPALPQLATRPASLEDEIALYSQALEQLNRDHAPDRALSTLNAYRFMHPDGVFRGEAIIAEIKAELLLGRDAEVLALLDVMHEHAFAGIPQKSEADLLRAELLTRAGRCEDALKSLDQHLDPSQTAEQRERALFSRASCRAQIKDFAGSREDLRAYLGEFPQGQFAIQATQLQNRLP